MKTKYFLLAGEEVSIIMNDEDFDELVKRLNNEGDDEHLIFLLYEYRQDNPEEPEYIMGEMLSHGMIDFFVISEEEHQILSDL